VANGPETPDCPLTVAVPTFNGAAHLAEALSGILAQRGVAFDLLVSDDRSEDGSIEVVRAVARDRARVEVNPQRLGLAGNWNRCVAMARAPIVAIFHQDDVMEPGHLAAHVEAFRRDDAIGLVASASVVIDERGDPVPEIVVGRGGLGPVDRILPAETLAAEMVDGNPLRCSAVTIRRAAFDDAGGFDPGLRYVLDWDFWLRVSRRWKLAWLARPTVRIRWHGASETHRFKSGISDLEESARMLDGLFSVDLQHHVDKNALESSATRRLARAFLTRAHDALHAGRPDLARLALRRGLDLSPSQVTTLLRDPRLGLQMAALAIAPKLSGRIFGGKPSGAPPDQSSVDEESKDFGSRPRKLMDSSEAPSILDEGFGPSSSPYEAGPPREDQP
jgi:GT2 family glycosyltransferase